MTATEDDIEVAGGKDSFRKDQTGKTKDGFESGEEKNRTAILLLDFQNEFVKKGGELHDEVAAVMDKNNTLENAATLLEFARKKDAMVIYSPVVMKDDETFSEQMVLKKLQSVRTKSSSQEFQKLKGLFTENTWNCEIAHEVAPKNDDTVLMDRTDFSAFAGTDLELILKMNNIDHLFIMGFLTDICVYQTTVDATNIFPDMSTYVVSDACAAKSMDAHHKAVNKIARSSANVVARVEAENMLEEYAESRKNRFDGSDEQWLLIDKIFAVADLNSDNKISIGELDSMSRAMPSINQLVSILSDSLGHGGHLSRESMHNILFERKPRRGFFAWVPIFIIQYLIPLLYSISTRLPFIFVALEIFEARQGGLVNVSWVLGVYQTSRALGNLLIVLFGGKNPFKRLQIFMVLCGLGGWLWLGFYERRNSSSFLCAEFAESCCQPTKDNDCGNRAPIWPLFGLFFVGLGESIVNLQRSLMIETGKESPSGIIDDSIIGTRLSVQYSMVAFGSIIAFVFGGWVYAKWGYTAVCEFGIAVQAVQLIGAVLYRCMARNSKKAISDDELDGNDLLRCVIYQFQTSSVIANYAKDVARGTENVDNREGSLGLSTAALRAKSDRVLTHSLREVYQFFFTKERDDITAMEDLLTSVDKTGTGLASNRPKARAVKSDKLAKLLLFLMKAKGGGSLTEREFISFWGPRVYLSLFKSSSEASVPVVWPYMKAVVATQAIAALCIGTFLTTALLSYNQRFGLDTAEVGKLLGIGEGIGMLILLFKGFIPSMGTSKGGNDFTNIIKAIITRPLNVPFILFVSSSSAMLFSVNNLTFAIVCQLFFSAVNDLSVSLMNELIGTSLPAEDFRFYQGIGQWLRRIGNMITAILGPMFFQISEAFPFLFFGLFVFIWSCILWVLMYLHGNKMDKANRAFSPDTASSKSWLLRSPIGIPFAPFVETTTLPWNNMEQRYYAQCKDTIEEELSNWKSAKVDISLMETRLRSTAAALEIEKEQRCALEDRIHAMTSKKAA